MDSTIIASIISSIIPTIALVVQFFSFKKDLRTLKQSESIKNIFQITEFINKPQMVDVYLNFRPNGEYTIKTWKDLSKEEIIAIYEYLEIFSFAYDMYKTELLDKTIFFKKFSYRITNFQDTPIVKSLLEKEPWEWESLDKLIAENEEYAISNYQRLEN